MNSQRDGRVKAPAIFQTLAADGAAECEDQRSLTRRLLMVLAVGLLAFGPLLWAGAAQAAGSDAPEAVLSAKHAAAAADDDDDDDDTTAGTGSGDSGTNSDRGTGAETQGNTDRGGQDTGKSTRGETEGRDGTGATERTQGTGRETAGNSDNGQPTGANTRGDTDGNGTDSISATGADTGDTSVTDASTG